MPFASRFRASLWEHDGPGAWHFVSLPGDVADEIADLVDGGPASVRAPRRGFGSVRVEVVVGTSRWRTSLFPDKSRGTYVLPVKKSVRAAQGLSDGSVVDVELTVLGPEDA